MIIKVKNDIIIYMNRDMIIPIRTEHFDTVPFHIVGMAADWAQKDLARPDGTDYYLMMECLSGYGEIAQGGRTFEVKRGTLVIWGPGTPQYYRNVGDEAWAVNWISFRTEAMPIRIDDGFFITESFPLNLGISKADTIKALIKTESMAEQIRGTGVLYEWLCEILIYEELKVSTVDGFDLGPVVDYMKHNLAQKLPLPKLSQLFGVSESYLCRLFKKYYKTTPIQFMTALRLNKAKSLLVNDQAMKILKVANLCGFEDQVYFTRVFKKHVGQTPSDYRKYNL